MTYIPTTIEGLGGIHPEGWGGDIRDGGSGCIFPYGWQGGQRDGGSAF